MAVTLARRHRLDKRHSLKALLALALLPCVIDAAAADFPIPNKPVRVVVGFPAGGGTDIQARQVGLQLQQLLGVPVVIDNKPGAGTMLAAMEVAKSAADGHTLLYTPSSTMAQLPHTLAAVKYDVFKDFTPVSLGSLGPLVLVVGHSRCGAVDAAIAAIQGGNIPGYAFRLAEAALEPVILSPKPIFCSTVICG